MIYKNIGITTFIVVFFLSLCSFSFAQSHLQKRWQFSLALNDAHSQIPFIGGADLNIDADGNMTSGGDKKNKSYSLSLITKYHISNDWALRFELGVTNIDLRNSGTKTISTGFLSSTAYGILYDTVKQDIFRFVPGIQLQFFDNKKIQFFGGVNVPIIQYNSIVESRYSETRNINTDTLIGWGYYNVRIPGGFATGLGVFVGFDISILKNLTLGAEFSSAFLYYDVGGITISEYNEQNFPNSIETATMTNSESYQGARFAKLLSSFNISFWF